MSNASLVLVVGQVGGVIVGVAAFLVVGGAVVGSAATGLAVPAARAAQAEALAAVEAQRDREAIETHASLDELPSLAA